MTDNHQKFAGFLAHAALAGCILVLLIPVAVWSFWEQLAPYAAANLQNMFNPRNLALGERGAGFAISLIGAVIQAFGLLGLRQTFAEAAQGRAFSARAIRGFRQFAWITFIMVFVSVTQRTGLILFFSLSDPFHEATINIQVGSNELKSLFLGLILVFVAQVFSEGKRAKEENESFL